MKPTKFGIHINPGSRNGYGEFINAGPAGGVFVNEDGAAHEMKTAYPTAITIGRFTSEDDGLYLEAPQGIDQWTPEQARAAWRDVYAERFETKWKAAHPCDAYPVINEGSNDDLSSLPSYLAYEDEAMKWAYEKGYQLCILNLAGGTPESFDFWVEHYVPHIQRASELGHYYGRHIYNLNETGCRHLVPGTENTNRVFRETEYLRSIGCNIGVIVTEAATCGGYTYDPQAMESQIPLYDALCQDDPSIVFWAWFTVGTWRGTQGDANCQDSFPFMTDYVRPRPAQPWTPPDIEPIPPPTEGYWKSIFRFDYNLFDYLDPREWTDEGNVQVQNGWRIEVGQGDSPLGDGEPWNVMGNPEGVFLPRYGDSGLPVLPVQEQICMTNNNERIHPETGVSHVGFAKHTFTDKPWHLREITDINRKQAQVTPCQLRSCNGWQNQCRESVQT